MVTPFEAFATGLDDPEYVLLVGLPTESMPGELSRQQHDSAEQRGPACGGVLQGSIRASPGRFAAPDMSLRG